VCREIKFKEVYVYVQSLDIASLFFFAGEVELENLPLKKDAFSSFGLPIKAHSGSIGKIKLQIPVRQFRSAPWCINIEKVYIVCGPVNLDEVSSQVLIKVCLFSISTLFTLFSGTTIRRSSQICTTNNHFSITWKQNGEPAIKTKVPIMRARTLGG
jgi:hypothetical protein